MKFADAERALWASFGVEPREEWLDLPATRVRVRTLTTGDGPAVVFVHGGSNAASSWVNLAVDLPDFTCVLVDRPGCGASPPMSQSLRATADLEAFGDAFVGDVIAALGLATAAVVGTSFGGYFALRGAGGEPERVSKLVTLGYSFGAPMRAAPLMMRFAADPRFSKFATALPAPKAVVKPMLRQIGLRGAVASGAFTPAMVDWFHALLNDTETMRNEMKQNPPVMTLRGINADVQFSDDALARITAPTLMLWGRDDPFGDESIARAFVRRVPGARLEMVAGGHAPWIDDVGGVANRMRGFLG